MDLNSILLRASRRRAVIVLASLLSVAASAVADPPSVREDAQFKVQFTDIRQTHGAFAERRPASVDLSKYSGSYPLYSLSDSPDRSWTRTLTFYMGARPWRGGEAYLNLEVTQGVPFAGNLVGMGGFYNGEITRTAGARPKVYRQRAFVRQTWSLDGEEEPVESDLNQMAGPVGKNRVVLTVGNFSLLDVFDKNAFSNDPRRQFMNWGHMNNLAWDYAADARGYGWGATAEWYQDEWVLRAGRMTGPREPNVLPIDFKIARHYGDQIEIEHRHEVAGLAGSVRLLAYRNRAILAVFSDAIAYGEKVGWQPDPEVGMEYILKVRGGEKNKYGVGVNVDQLLTDDLGAFLKGLWSDGRTETYAFGEVDRSLAVGLALKGRRWGRAEDTVGLSGLVHLLSGARRDYLRRGGISYFIGDGWLNYRPEQIFEAYYSLGLGRKTWVTADLQRVWNPAYNADRGPLNIYGLRLHAEF